MHTFVAGDRVMGVGFKENGKRLNGKKGAVLDGVADRMVGGEMRPRLVVKFDDVRSEDDHGQFALRPQYLQFLGHPVRNEMGDQVLEMSMDGRMLIKRGPNGEDLLAPARRTKSFLASVARLFSKAFGARAA